MVSLTIPSCGESVMHEGGRLFRTADFFFVRHRSRCTGETTKDVKLSKVKVDKTYRQLAAE